MATVPILHLVGKSTATADEAWRALSSYAGEALSRAGKPGPGLPEIPAFKGSKPAQAKQAIALSLRARKIVERALARSAGTQPAAIFAVSSAGHLAKALNQIGIPNLNRQLGQMIEDAGLTSGMNCLARARTASAAATGAKPADVVKAWDRDIEGAEKAFAQKATAAAGAAPADEAGKASQKSARSSASRSKDAGRSDDLLDDLDEEIDPNTVPPR